MATLSDKTGKAPPGSWVPAYSLFLLYLAYGLNIADRALLGIVVDPVKADLGLSDTEMSLVSGTAFVLFNLLVGIFIARWVDRGNRKHILILGVSLWSAATALTGMAEGFLSLAATRILVGVGEATAFPVAISMIADLFIAPRRPRAVGILQSSTFVGVVLGSIAAGMLAALYGWRAMFAICGIAGFLLVLLIAATMREPARIAQGQEAAPAAPTLWRGLSGLARVPGFVPLSIGAGVASMTAAVLPVWAPTFLLRSHDVALANVGALIGPAVGIGGVTGAVGAGMLASRFARRRGSEVYGILVPLVALPLAVPCYLLFCFAPSLALTMIAAALMNVLLSSSLGPCVAAAVAIAPSSMRALSSTLMLAASGLIGAALSPLIVGLISDALAPTLGLESLRYGMAAMAVTPLLGWLILWRAYARCRAALPAAPGG